MIISLIVGVGKNREIGKDNKLLWHIPEDFKKFKKLTMGHHLLMGRKTYESIGKPLPGRQTIVLSRNRTFCFDAVEAVASITQGIEFAKKQGEEELFVIGGSSVYEACLPLCHRLYISKVDFEGEADTYFPEYEKFKWSTVVEENFEATEMTPQWKFLQLEKTPKT